MTETANLVIHFKGKSSHLRARLVAVKGQPPNIPDDPTLKAIVLHLKEKEFHIEKHEKEKVRLYAPPLLNLGDLLAAAHRHLGFSSSKTLSLALDLYERVDAAQKPPLGLITFPITDSRWIPEDERLKVREYIYLQYGREYLPDNALMGENSSSNGVGAVRPLSLQRPPRKLKKHLSADELLLYSLIWDSFIKAHMTDAVVSLKKVMISDSLPGFYKFCSENSIIEHRGFRSVSEAQDHQPFSAAGEEWRVGQKLTPAEIELLPAADKKPSLTEADLIEYLNSNQACIPEQLPLIPEILRLWNLVDENQGRLTATEPGQALARLLQAVHPELLNLKIVQKIVMRIKEGGDRNSADKLLIDLENVIGQPLISAVAGKDSLKAAKRRCPVCGNRLSIKRAPAGDYIVCDGYPLQCRYSRRVEEETRRFYGYCSECSHELVVKIGRYGRFLACSGFPKCTFTKPFPTGVRCPKEGCSGEIVERVPKNGQLFYGCDQYPRCRFSSRLRPVNSACPQCGNLYMVVGEVGASAEKWLCPKCKYELNDSAKVGRT
jgi:DNA topoisomerase-1